MSFVTAKLSELSSKWVGESEKNMASLFETARRNKPCILFLDEIDSLAGQRGDSSANAPWRNDAVNQLLTEIDGTGAGNEGVLVVGATNMPWLLDVAVTRREGLRISFRAAP